MTKTQNAASAVKREDLVKLLNDDLAREYQAIIAYVVYSQVLKGAPYMNIAGELEKHAAEELQHALTLSNQIDYLGGMPTVVPKPVKTSEKWRRCSVLIWRTKTKPSVIIESALGSATPSGTLFLVLTKSISWGNYLIQFFIPTLFGNIIGGVSLVAALGHAQVVGGKP